MTTDLGNRLSELREKHLSDLENMRGGHEARVEIADLCVDNLDTIISALTASQAQVERFKSEVEEPALSDNDLYYLRSIKRNLDDLHEIMPELIEQGGPCLGGEVLADNRDWLDCFIDQHERRRSALSSKEKSE